MYNIYQAISIWWADILTLILCKKYPYNSCTTDKQMSIEFNIIIIIMKLQFYNYKNWQMYTIDKI